MVKLHRVLLVDDDEICRFMAEMVVSGTGIVRQLSFAADGLEASAMVRETRFDAVLLDINMQEADGFDFLESLERLREREGLSAPAVFMLSSSVNEEEKARALRYPAVRGFLRKPLTEEHLHYILNIIAGAAY